MAKGQITEAIAVQEIMKLQTAVKEVLYTEAQITLNQHQVVAPHQLHQTDTKLIHENHLHQVLTDQIVRDLVATDLEHTHLVQEVVRQKALTKVIHRQDQAVLTEVAVPLLDRVLQTESVALRYSADLALLQDRVNHHLVVEEDK